MFSVTHIAIVIAIVGKMGGIEIPISRSSPQLKPK